MKGRISLLSLLLVTTVSVVVFWQLSAREPETIFDVAFEEFGLSGLEPCPGYNDQREIFRSNRGDLPHFSEVEREIIETNWARFLGSERGQEPSPCDWTITTYPAGFVASNDGVVIVINPSRVVMGVDLPDDSTGDLVMDATRYSGTSLGAFRGAATIPPETIAVIALR